MSVADHIPIFMMRLVEESGESSTGARATVGRLGVLRVMRSCTKARAWRRSVPIGNKIRIEESPSTDFERIAVRPGVPASAASRGVVTSASTSSLESPGASV